jgi:tetratricopeptide (TPR) repeat protein
MTPHANSARDREDIFESVACIFEKAAEKTPIILFIEDLHSIDVPSGALLLYLLNRFQPGEELPILFLLTTGNTGWMGSDAAHAAKAMQCFTVEIRPPDREQRAQILSTGLGLDCDVAVAIVRRVGNVPVKGGELFMLFRYVTDLTEKGYFRKSGDRFVWSEVYKGDDKLPTPDTIATMLADCWQKNPAYRDTLECAACQGPEFSASVLSRSLGTEHFKLLRQLREIEETTGLIRDIISKDDRCEFCSRLVFDAIRGSFGNVALGPRATDVPKVVREYHARTAAAMEATFSRSSSRMFEIANLYYAAGARHAREAVESCMKAARAARNMLAFGDAVQYVQKAREYSDALGQPLPMEEEEMLLIHCHQAHVVGGASLRVQAANYVQSYLEKHADPSEEVLGAAARTLYEAAKDDRGLFEKAVEVGRWMVQRGRSTIEKSEGLHFIGISLPPEQASERERYLREAYEILKTSPRDDLAAQALLARVANSLAEQLSDLVSRQGRPEIATATRDEIRNLFLLSLEIKSRPELLDRPGQARTHGGLGRMYLKLEPRDLPSAREHFISDLELSRDLKDMSGQCQVLSHLGECDLEEEKFLDALEHYQQSLQLASSDRERLFALAGILASAVKLADQEGLQTAGLQILELAKHHQPIREGLVEKIHSTLANCSLCAGEPWREELLEMINNSAQPGAH